MGNEQARNLRRQGIAAAKAGQRDQARALLQQAVRLEPDSEAAWIWLASLAVDRRERLFCFQKLLEINPRNETALNALQAMGISPQQLLQAQETAPAQEQAAAPAAPLRPGVPVPDAQQIASAQQRADEVLRQVQLTSDQIEGVEWVQKSRRRAGERDRLVLRLYVWAGAVGILAAILLIGGLVVWNTPSLRGVVFAPTWTPSPLPTLTPTSTPGFTPTPSPTPELTLTPSPTIDPDIPQGRIDVQPVPTRLYPETINRRLSDAVDLMNRGAYEVALPTLVRERESTELSFDAAPYYYESLALLGVGDPQSALERLQEAESRLGEVRDPGFKPLVDTGLARTYLRLAEDALAENNTSQAFDYLDQTERYAQAAIEGDPLMVPAYIALARRHELEQDYDDALQVINDALSRPELKADVNLIVQRANSYLQQGELDLASQDAFTALYIDPTVEEAYLLQMEIAMAEDDPGLAVIYAQNYLFFYPGSAEGYKLLGDARLAEGNTDLALAAYNQALAAEEITPATVDALIARADIYTQQRRYDLAHQDLTQAINLSDNPEIRASRMEVAYLAGNLSAALTDVEELRGSGIVPDSEINLLEARILIDRADEDDTETLNDALGLLNQANNSSPVLQAVANEYRARAQFLLGEYDSALSSVDNALNTLETGSRHFLRGQILEALDQPEQALREYEWIMTWSEVYPYPFVPDARRRLNNLRASSSEAVDKESFSS